MQGTVALSDVLLRGPSRDSDRWRIKATSDLKDIVITTTFLDEPFEIPSGRLTASDAQTGKNEVTTLSLDSIRLSHGTHAVTIAGEVGLSADETRLDLNIAAEDLDWSEIERISDRIAKHGRGESRPVRGRIDVRAEHFTFDRFRNTPFYAVVDFDHKRTDVLIEQAGFCGMTLIGRISFDGPMVDAYLVPVVNGMSLDSVATCLTNEKSRITGNFNLDGSLQVNARREDLTKALKGRLRFVSEDGSILESGFFVKLFSLLNLTEIYRGQFPGSLQPGAGL